MKIWLISAGILAVCLATGNWDKNKQNHQNQPKSPPSPQQQMEWPKTFTDQVTVHVSCGGPDIGYAWLVLDNVKWRFLHGDQTYVVRVPGTHKLDTWGSCDVN